jgi:predicted small secreted protein
MKRSIAPAALALVALSLTGCASMPGAGGDAQFSACPAYAPAYQVTDDFMSTFNSKNAEAWGATFHFPSVRIASGNVRIINSAADLEQSFGNLEATGWDRSDWAKRQVVQCGPTKAHMLTTFVRYRKDGSVLSQFDSLYIVEFKNDRWALTARSSFAP